MTINRDDAALRSTKLVGRIRANLLPPADELLIAFFDPERPFAGSTFDDLYDNPSDRFTASDLVAATLLDMRFSPRAVRAILDSRADLLATLLSGIPEDVDLWHATEDDLAAANRLYQCLRSGGPFKGVGHTTTSKLMARKRPRLVPIVDSVVRDALGLTDAWNELRVALRAEGLPLAIEALRPVGVGPVVSTLRLLDAAVWMRHSRGRAAVSVRRSVGLAG